MRKLCLLLFINVCLICSCDNEKQFYSLNFKSANTKAIADSLTSINAFFKKLQPMSPYSAEIKDSFIVTRVEPDLISLLYDGSTLAYNLTNEVNWANVESNSKLFSDLPWLHNYSEVDKSRFLNLIQFLIKNEISGVECCSEQNAITRFIFRGVPFADRHDMIIIFEGDFNKLSQKEKSAFLNSQLIIDKQNGLILLVQDKSRFLRYIYHDDNSVPQKWLTATEEVFHVGIEN